MQKIPQCNSQDQIDLALIDFDVLRYEIGSVKFDHPLGAELGKVPPAKEYIEALVDSRIEEIMYATNAKDFICYITGPGNFRFDIAKQEPYKGNRSDVEKPYHWATVDEYGRSKYNCTEILGTEADDELGIIQRYYNQAGVSTVICSRDKDLRMVEGLHFSWKCGENQPAKPVRYITFLDGMKFFFQQLLTGDPVDNIMGCGIRETSVYGPKAAKAGQEYRRRVGVGAKAASILLAKGDGLQEWYEIVKTQYEKRFNADEFEDILLENARLLYIGQKSSEDLFVWSRIGVKDGTSNVQDEQEQDDTGLGNTTGERNSDDDLREARGGDDSESFSGISEEHRPF